MKTIHVIVKLWNGGKIEIGDSFYDEKRARYAASQELSMEYTISIFTSQLKDEVEKESQIEINWLKTSEDRENG